jgi:hypothetical protein
MNPLVLFKQCVTCRVERPLARFELGRRTCRDCVNARTRASGRRTYTPERNRKYEYGLDNTSFLEMLYAQHGACAICGRVGGKLVVDHDHVTGRVRGLLCDRCNRGIGHLGDDPDRCWAAARYLRSSEASHCA